MGYSIDHANERQTKVQGCTYMVWADFIRRCTYARNESLGETRCIHAEGYLSNDLTVRKAIAVAFGHTSFRK